MDEYRQISVRALNIMKIRFDENESQDKLIQRIRFALVMPATSTEVEIKNLSQQIAAKIENRAEVSEIEDLLEKLDFEVSFLVWD